MAAEGFAPLVGDGKAEMMVMDQRGMVIWRFKKPMSWIGLDPANAMQIAGATIKAAQIAKTGKAPPPGAIEGIVDSFAKHVEKKITKAQRDVLVNRVVLMMASMTRQKRNQNYQAQQIVDIILSGTSQ